VLGGVFGLASVIGPALGGFLTDHGSWRWVFYVNVPLGLVALAFIGFLMPKVASVIKDKVIDYWGAGLIAATLVPLLLALSWGGNQYAWNSGIVLGLFGLAAASLAAFVWAEHKAKEPIIPLELFKNSVFTWSMIILFLMGAAMFGAIIYIPLFGQLVQGVSATDSGTILTPLMIGLIGSSVIAGQIIAKTGKYRLIALLGTAMLALSLLWLSTLTVETSHWWLVAEMVALGISLGLTMPVFNIAVQNAFDRDKMGVVTASTQTFRNIGGTVGTAVLGAVFNDALVKNAAGLAGTPYAQGAAQHGVHVTNVNALEGLLSTQGQAVTLAAIAQMPQEVRGAATLAFQDFILQAKQAFTTATDHLFLVAAVISCVALVACLFLKEIPLRQAKKHDATTEAGDQLAVELGQSQPKDEPALT
jgi:MFS family permease